MSQFFLDNFICPECKVELNKNKDSYCCKSCNQTFTFKDGIYNFLPQSLTCFEHKEAQYHSKVAIHYDELAQLDALRNKYYHQDFLNYILKLPKESKILEIGCGTGEDGLKILKSGFNLVESDISEEMLKLAKSKAQKDGLLEKTAYVLAMGDKIPFKNNSFDAIFMVASLHHFVSPVSALKEIKRCVRPGGLIILGIEPNCWFYYTIYPVVKLLKKLKKKSQNIPSSSVADESTYGFGRRAIRNIINKVDLEIIDLKPVWFLNGFLHTGLMGLNKLLKRKKAFRIGGFFEKTVVNIDESLAKIPLINNFCWHWNIIAKKPR